MTAIRLVRALPLVALLWSGSASADPPRARPNRDGSRTFLSPPPARRVDCRAAYDTKGHRMIVFGGLYNATTFRDAWALADGSEGGWEELFPGGKPPPSRWGHSIVYDPSRNRMLVFGGNNQSVSFGDLWSLSLSSVPSWTELAPGGPRPSPRLGHSAIYDPVRRRMIVFGGFDGRRRNDVWALTLGSESPRWERIPARGALPPERNAHVAVYDAARDRMVVFAGVGIGDDLNDVWSLSLSGTPTWTEITPNGPGPGPRRQSAGVYDPAHRRLIVYGGQDGGSGPGYQDVWSLDLDGEDGWTEWSEAAPPGRRWGHTAVYATRTGGMLVFGGVDLADWKNDAWLLGDPGDFLSPAETRHHSWE